MEELLDTLTEAVQTAGKQQPLYWMGTPVWMGGSEADFTVKNQVTGREYRVTVEEI